MLGQFRRVGFASVCFCPLVQLDDQVMGYPFLADLLALEAHSVTRLLRPELEVVTTPLITSKWAAMLQQHPDQAFAQYVMQGLQSGFRVGCSPSKPLRSAKSNMHSAREHSQVIDGYLAEEVELGRIVGPIHNPGGVHVNRFGVIPKSVPGKWRLITDLSAPQGYSVNDGIAKELCSLSYISVDDIAHQAVQLGRGALLAKLDIKSAYRLVPVHPSDRPLLGMAWHDEVYVDTRLPFGLRSAPKIFTAVADALEWGIRQRGVRFVGHYLDDFATFGPPDSPECQENVRTIMDTCKELGVPLAPEKQEGPTTKLTLLGIEINTEDATLALPPAKLLRLQQDVARWDTNKSCTRKELESLLGTLQFACRVIPAGRSFLRRMIALLSQVKSAHHHIRLNRHFRSDLAWWKVFSSGWNGVGLLPQRDEAPAVCLATDASGSWGCGGWYGSRWFQLQWPQSLEQGHIAVKELIPIVIALAVLGKYWCRRRVTCYCDNGAVVAVMRSRCCRDPALMHLLRCMFFFEARFSCKLSVVHISGVLNDRADDLSRNRLSSFFSKVPGADRFSTPIPASLLHLLESSTLDWTSQAWRQQFTAYVQQA